MKNFIIIVAATCVLLSFFVYTQTSCTITTQAVIAEKLLTQAERMQSECESIIQKATEVHSANIALNEEIVQLKEENEKLTNLMHYLQKLLFEARYQLEKIKPLPPSDPK